MKKWFNFFCLSFFSHKISKEGARRGYVNTFLGFLLALVLLWSAFVGGEMLPFGTHYGNSPDFRATVHAVLANADADKRIEARIESGVLKMRKAGGEFSESLLINTLESDLDRQNYSVNGYSVVVDTRPADTLAEVEAFCVSNDGKNTEISYEDYLTLSDVARLNFDFKLRYTGNALLLDDGAVDAYVSYLNGQGEESIAKIQQISDDLAENKITKSEYNREIYKLYFTNYYPEIAEYESASAVPLLRNYYYHQYISKGIKNYLFIFDDYMTGSFETEGGIEISFYGFYNDLADGELIAVGAAKEDAGRSADAFIKSSFDATRVLTVYAHTMNTISLVPFIALMLLVATLLTYSVLKLGGVESITSLGAMLRIVGSYVWFSGAIAAALSVAAAFFVSRSLISVLPLVLFFVTLAVRSVIFAVKESRLYKLKQSEQEVRQTEA